jgi:hypothetical protein
MEKTAICSMGQMRNSYEYLEGKSERKRPLWKPARRRYRNIKMNIKNPGMTMSTGFNILGTWSIGGSSTREEEILHQVTFIRF